MHRLNKLIAEIVELSAFRSTCCHYLASHHAALHVENATMVTANKHIVSQSLNQLYQELNVLNTTIYKGHNSIKQINYKYSAHEERAILHFNKDNRFTITE
jgi:hypothetical protein